ncbi:MAG: hypothetical protein HY729_10220 [Candidatus Rokubacteria bacterium]|nr:hypothetical protein [Candidatus Rokubacteria bacterium]
MLALIPAAAPGQVFLASRPNPGFTVGPLFVRATVGPTRGPVEVAVVWSLAVPPGRSGAAVEQDLYLLWPGAVDGALVAGAPDPALRRYVAERGFSPVREGRLPLAARQLYGSRRREAQPLEGGAPFVTYVREAGALVRSAPATWIRIPWTPRLVNRTWLIELRMRLPDLVQTRQASWLETVLWGERHTLALAFHDVRTRSAFPMYFEHRDRVVHLGEEPSQLVINFADAGHLKIREILPAAHRRQPSETRKGTEVVSLFLDPAEGLRPQLLTVQFGYFTGWKSWAPILFATAFFMLGNIAGPLVTMLARSVGARLAGRIHFGRGDRPRESQTGVIVARETLEQLAPGRTTYDEVLALCGPHPEEHEQLRAPERRVLIYRGRKIAPERRRRLGWLATVNRWHVEHHEVEIALEHGVVTDVQARVRRTHLAHPERA